MNQFSSFWNNLKKDEYVANFTHRERRIAKFIVQGESINPLEDNTVNTSTKYNQISGGQVRYYEPAEPAFLEDPLFKNILNLNSQIGKKFLDSDKIKVTCQIFRIIPQDTEPTPVTNGIHKDETQLVALHFIQAQNIAGGVTKLYDNNKNFIQGTEIQLKNSLETFYIDDESLFHETSPIYRVNTNEPSYRDVLIMTMEKV